MTPSADRLRRPPPSTEVIPAEGGGVAGRARPWHTVSLKHRNVALISDNCPLSADDVTLSSVATEHVDVIEEMLAPVPQGGPGPSARAGLDAPQADVAPATRSSGLL
jgi:hypothetical protein